ncbi:hypothetical protein C8F04DRAFT_328395 [Mycena alexandri]|uniref:DUF5648 domain-containing protein n=1 Tax=Mycena alexandri TaxID=1745969 RepID=A0AAD6S1Y4_9AGAR|nr:hypothetical protein C8F04DRAFT_328395 [Mycena alexandri]
MGKRQEFLLCLCPNYLPSSHPAAAEILYKPAQFSGRFSKLAMNFPIFIFALSFFVVGTAATCGNASDAVPLYLASSSAFADNLYDTTVADISNNVGNGVYRFEGVAASVFLTQELSTVALFRQFNPSIADHFYTIDPVERDNALSEDR